MTIYSLCDSRETDPVARVRYIGQTVRPLAVRLRRHVADAKGGEDTHRARWMRSVWRGGGAVVIEPIKVVSRSEWGHAEIDTIAAHRLMGCRLTNGTDGGDGMLNPSLATRKKLSQSRRGNQHRIGQRHSDETRAKMSASHLGHKNSQEAIAKQVESRRQGRGYAQTPEARALVSAANRGRRHHPEAYASRRAKFSGAGNPASKLNWGAVRAIRAAFLGGSTKSGLGRTYGVSAGAIDFIVKNQTWVEQ